MDEQGTVERSFGWLYYGTKQDEDSVSNQSHQNKAIKQV